MRIRSRLFLLVVAIVFPSLVGTGLGIYYIYDQQRDSYKESIQDLTRAMALLLDKEMAARENALHILSHSPTITDNDLPEFYRFAKEVASTWDTVIVLSDFSGQQFLNTRTPFNSQNLPKIISPLMEQRSQQGAEVTLVSDIYYAPIGKHPSFAVQIPVKREKRVLYHLTMGTFTTQLQSLLDEQKLPSGWVATILDRQGVVAARTRDADKFVGKTANETLRHKINTMNEGTNKGVTFDGVPVMAFFSRAPKSDWSVVVSVPLSALHEPAVQASYLVAAIALLLLGAGITAAAIVARKTARSMEDLRHAAVDLGLGRLVARQSTGVEEIDEVSLEMAKANERIRTSQAELEIRVADAVETAKRSQQALLQSQKLEALGRLTGGIAHDFNNIMQTLTTGLQLALFSPMEPRVKQCLETCKKAVERASQLTRQLMAFGRVQEASLETLKLAQKIEEIQPLLKGALGSNIVLEFDIEENLWPVTADPLQLELALLNITINARDAMPRGGLIRVTCRNSSVPEVDGEHAAGDYVQISVMDTGEGMTPEVLAKALDPFFTTKPVGHGSGMGLSQAYGFARQVGGKLTIQSKPDQGTTVTFHIPRTQPASLAMLRQQPFTAQPKATASGRLLFVEDDNLVAAVVAPALKAAGFDVHVAENAEEAQDLLTAQGPFDVVFSDVVMPGTLSGFDLAEYVTKHYPNTRIVLATGYSEHQIKLPGIEILAKPYKVDEAVELLCRRV